MGKLQNMTCSQRRQRESNSRGAKKNKTQENETQKEEKAYIRCARYVLQYRRNHSSGLWFRRHGPAAEKVLPNHELIIAAQTRHHENNNMEGRVTHAGVEAK